MRNVSAMSSAMLPVPRWRLPNCESLRRPAWVERISVSTSVGAVGVVALEPIEEHGADGRRQR